jgi:methylase of polypeptide subunit release factors
MRGIAKWLMKESTYLLRSLNSLTSTRFIRVSEDSIQLFSSRPRFILEVGSGSGCVITYISSLLHHAGISHCAFATDINPAAVQCENANCTLVIVFL